MPTREQLAKAIYRALRRQERMFLPYVDPRPRDMDHVTIDGEVSLLLVASELLQASAAQECLIAAAIREVFGTYVSERRIADLISALRRRGCIVGRVE